MAPLWPLTFSSGERPRALWALLFQQHNDGVRGNIIRFIPYSLKMNVFNVFFETQKFAQNSFKLYNSGKSTGLVIQGSVVRAPLDAANFTRVDWC